MLYPKWISNYDYMHFNTREVGTLGKMCRINGLVNRQNREDVYKDFMGTHLKFPYILHHRRPDTFLRIKINTLFSYSKTSVDSQHMYTRPKGIFSSTLFCVWENESVKWFHIRGVLALFRIVIIRISGYSYRYTEYCPT